MIKCQYYLNGVCYSPVTIKTFGEPSGEPVDATICNSDRYKNCRFYVEQRSVMGENVEDIIESEVLEIYPKIHIIPCDTVSQCPFYQSHRVNQENNLCIARCVLFDKYITASNVKRCIDYWRDCPIYRYGLSIQPS